jgi:hypothetical protein
MFHSREAKWLAVSGLLLAVVCVALIWAGSSTKSVFAAPPVPAGAPGDYVVLAWNDLGMHCYDPDFQDLAVLPPFNTLWVQVVQVGEPPHIVTAGITVTYLFTDNTYSVGKSDFWTYAQELFDLPDPLPPNIGLAGKGLSGTMDLEGDHFVATGIPLTEYRDSNLTVPDHYQLATIIVSAAPTGTELARNLVVAPVSTELMCVNCHSDDGDATTTYPISPTGKVETNILVLHDYLSQNQYPPGHTGPLMERRPVLCAECHASSALGTPGVPPVNSLSNAMHKHHAGLPDITPDTAGCYNCHPGPETQCLRDVMSQEMAINCLDCHGDMQNVSENPNPWLNEPRCDNAACHGAGYSLTQPLYRMSKGHANIYCAACHDSPHAIAPSREPNDGVKFVNLQGHSGTLRQCTACHATQPIHRFQHSAPPTTVARTYLPLLLRDE